MPLVGGFGCLEFVLYGIGALAEQHYEPSRPMRAKHRWLSTNESGEDYRERERVAGDVILINTQTVRQADTLEINSP